MSFHPRLPYLATKTAFHLCSCFLEVLATCPTYHYQRCSNQLQEAAFPTSQSLRLVHLPDLCGSRRLCQGAQLNDPRIPFKKSLKIISEPHLRWLPCVRQKVPSQRCVLVPPAKLEAFFLSAKVAEVLVPSLWDFNPKLGQSGFPLHMAAPTSSIHDDSLFMEKNPGRFAEVPEQFRHFLGSLSSSSSSPWPLASSSLAQQAYVGTLRIDIGELHLKSRDRLFFFWKFP